MLNSPSFIDEINATSMTADAQHYEDLKGCENVSQCAGGATPATGMHLAIGILTGDIGKPKTG